MKRIVFALALMLTTASLFAQKIPNVQLKSLDQKTVQSKGVIVNEKGGPTLLCFWATWCKPCVKELNIYNDLYPDWAEETGVKIVLVSVDNARSMSRVAPFVSGKAWDFDVYIDSNSDLKRAMNVINVPHTFLLDKDGKVVWQHTSFMDGDEEEVYEQIKKLVK